jgi:glycosyltransferase involved in cell wall biosynthesis
MTPTVDLSIVIPFLDEAPNLSPLHAELVPVLDALGPRWEIIYVDDGSTDEGPAIAAALAASDPRVRLVSLARNYGQSTALVAGVEAARGQWIATLDGDGQNDPADLAVLWPVIESGEAQMVNATLRFVGSAGLVADRQYDAKPPQRRHGDRCRLLAQDLPTSSFLERSAIRGHASLPANAVEHARGDDR